MDERINSLTPYLRKAIVDAARKGAEEAVEKLFVEQRAEAERQMKAQRTNKFVKLKPKESRTETYPISVKMTGGYNGQQEAEVWIDGVKSKIKVEERFHGPLPSLFAMTFIDEKGDWDRLPDAKTFESAVQQGIVMLLGHAWYGGD